MNQSYTPFEQSNQFTKLILDYINSSELLHAFYTHSPSIESYADVIKQKNYNNALRPILVDTVSTQYAQCGIDLKKHKLVSNNIQLLLNEETYTVTTGHQLCLFTGPLYFIYKIISTIKWCDELRQAYPNKNFVPVFWMASEDHDFEEVNHVYIGKDKLSWDIDSNQLPVGQIPIANFEQLTQALLDKCENDFARNQVQTFINFYTSSKNLSEATRKLVHHLFADKGVVILDADDKNLKQAFIPYIKKDIMEQSNFKTLHQTNLQLKKHYKTQVNGREINFFYLSDKGRSLIKQDKGNFYVEDTDLTFSVDELEKEIESNPEKFSPNVILRPLYQEVILPNLSYIGGPGEIAYWLQLKDVFASNQVAFPILTLRSFVLLLREQHYNQLNKLGLSPIDLFMTPIDIERKLVALNNDGGQKDISLQFDQYLQQLIDIANKTDNQISSELIAHKTEWKKKLVHLNQKLDQKQREKVKLKSDKAIRIQQEYFKGHTMQERYENMLTYGINRDVKQFIEVVFNAVSHNTQGIHNIVIQG